MNSISIPKLANLDNESKCLICYENHDNNLVCSRGCTICPTCGTKNKKLRMLSNFKVLCLTHNCPGHYDVTTLLPFISNKKLRDRILELYSITYLQKNIPKIYKLAYTCTESDLLTHITLAKQQIGHQKLYQCPKCNCGPISLKGCADLKRHNEEYSGGSRINNACPKFPL